MVHLTAIYTHPHYTETIPRAGDVNAYFRGRGLQPHTHRASLEETQDPLENTLLHHYSHSIVTLDPSMLFSATVSSSVTLMLF